MRTAREGGVAFGGAGVGHGADEIAFADHVGDEGGVAEGVVEFEEGGIGGAGFTIREEHAAFEGGAAGGVKRGDAFLVEEEDHFAAGGGEGGPAGGEDGLFEGFVGAADIVRGEELGGGEDGADFGVEGVEGGGGELFGDGHVAGAGNVRFVFDQDEDGEVAGVGFGPDIDEG